jgi:molybdenum cofactor biosynthesis protein B
VGRDRKDTGDLDWGEKGAEPCWPEPLETQVPIDESRAFIPLSIVVLTISDSRTDEDDRSGSLLADLAVQAGHEVVAKKIIPDDQLAIQRALGEWIDHEAVDVVIATGGTGVTGRDVTPEAFAAVYDKEIPGFGELFRWLSYAKIGTSTIQSRATGGIAGGTYLFALPGSPSACRDAWEGILISQLDSRWRPCNFAELLPRLKER